MMARCFECGSTGETHDHHVVPRSRGGTRTVPLCLACHAKAHHRSKSMASGRLTSAALRAKRTRGELTGRAPWGYRVGADGVTLEADAGEQRIVAMVRRHADRGLSQRAIAREVNAAGCRNRAGQPFTNATIGRILSAELAPVLEARAAEVAPVLRESTE